MEKLLILTMVLALLSYGCKGETTSESPATSKSSDLATTSMASVKEQLTNEGYQIFDFVDTKTKDTILMQQYFIAFLKSGEKRNQSKEQLDSLQTAHLAHLRRMYDEGYASISGPFGDDGTIRGITIYNVATKQQADSLANLDPMVKAGRLKIETHPWWAAKGYSLR